MGKRTYRLTYIRQWREARGLSLRALAGRLEQEPGEELISHASLQRIETGSQPYSQPILEAIANALSVTPTQLLEHDPTKQGEVVDMFAGLDNDQRDDFARTVAAMTPDEKRFALHMLKGIKRAS
jgi:transcriptional regulator with XRE-family HTH domain